MSNTAKQLPTGFAEGHTWKALVAYKMEVGMSQDTAEAWATSNLSPGVKIWKDGFDKGADGADYAMASAFIALKTWATGGSKPTALK